MAAVDVERTTALDLFEQVQTGDTKLKKIQDEERESKFGLVHAVSGPGTVFPLFPSFSRESPPHAAIASQW